VFFCGIFRFLKCILTLDGPREAGDRNDAFITKIYRFFSEGSKATIEHNYRSLTNALRIGPCDETLLFIPRACGSFAGLIHHSPTQSRASARQSFLSNEGLQIILGIMGSTMRPDSHYKFGSITMASTRRAIRPHIIFVLSTRVTRPHNTHTPQLDQSIVLPKNERREVGASNNLPCILESKTRRFYSSTLAPAVHWLIRQSQQKGRSVKH
jgi:hypothetical protein